MYSIAVANKIRSMASKKSTGSKLTMKLLVNSKTHRVLYGEAGKDVVDFLFSLPTLTVDTMVGSVGNLYGSVENLDDAYISRGDAKKTLLTPAAGCQGGKLLQLEPAPPACFYRCSNNNGNSYTNCRNYVTKLRGATCRNCHAAMNTQLVEIVEAAAGSVGDADAVSPAAGAGLVHGIVTYTVMDDLKVSPMSSISGITLLNTFGVTDIGSLQEKTVQLGYDEGLEILKASLQSKTVLTDVFLAKKRKA